MAHSGWVKFFDVERGFGFIVLRAGEQEVYVNSREVLGRQLRDGDEVYFDLSDARWGKPSARKVTGGTGEVVERQDWGRDNQRSKGRGKGGGGKGGRSRRGSSREGAREHQEALKSLALLGSGVVQESLQPMAELFDLEAEDDAEHADEEGLAVATYNLLHPFYAVKYEEVEGVARGSGGDLASNWDERAPALAALLVAGGLDAYLLQEVGLKQILDLRRCMGGERTAEATPEGDGVAGWILGLGDYDCVHFTHPTRAARDGVAVLLRRSRLRLRGHRAVPLLGKGVEEAWEGKPYMCAGIALAEDSSGRHIVFASAHLYDKKTRQPQSTLLQALDPECLRKTFGVAADAVIWGGDCNRSYGSAMPGFTFKWEGMQPTRPGASSVKEVKKYIDWIFASEACTLSRPLRAQRFVALTGLSVRATGHRASDHKAEALVVGLPPRPSQPS